VIPTEVEKSYCAQGEQWNSVLRALNQVHAKTRQTHVRVSQLQQEEKNQTTADIFIKHAVKTNSWWEINYANV
jgi:hypothetical protein